MSTQNADAVRVIVEQLSHHVLHDHRTGARHDYSVAEALLIALDKAGYQIVRQSDGYGERIGHSQECLRAAPNTPCLCAQSDGSEGGQ